jgi:mannitol-1-/sugar-/sorbitol-6-phosphatase
LPRHAAPGTPVSRAAVAGPLSFRMLDGIAHLTCEALLFDLDGVLVDSTACIERTWHSWAARHGLDVATVLSAAHGRRAVETVRLTAPHLDAAAEAAALAAHESRATVGVSEVPGARELLATLPPARWGVVTSGVRAVAEHRLRHVGLPVPAVMVCADEVTWGKPSPEGYLVATARLGIAPGGCVVVEDAPAGIEAAAAGGMRVIAVATTHRPDELRGAEAVASTLSALTVRVNGRGRAQRLDVEVSLATPTA